MPSAWGSNRSAVSLDTVGCNWQAVAPEVDDYMSPKLFAQTCSRIPRLNVGHVRTLFVPQKKYSVCLPAHNKEICLRAWVESTELFHLVDVPSERHRDGVVAASAARWASYSEGCRGASELATDASERTEIRNSEKKMAKQTQAMKAAMTRCFVMRRIATARRTIAKGGRC